MDKELKEKVFNHDRIRIIVKDQKTKENMIRESEYLHDSRTLDSDMCNTLMHLYLLPEEAWVIREDNPSFVAAEMELMKQEVERTSKILLEAIRSIIFDVPNTTDGEKKRIDPIVKRLIINIDASEELGRKIVELRELAAK